MQSWIMPVSDDVLDTALTSYVPNALKTLRSLHSGATEPSEMVAYMLWADTTTGLLKIRNAANSAWIIYGSLSGSATPRLTASERVNLSASTEIFMPPPLIDVTLSRIVLLSQTTTSSSSGNEWQFVLNNLTQATTLFSATVGTFTTLGGVGGGEITLHVPYLLTPDQNNAIDAGDVIELEINKVGAATTIGRMSIYVDYEAR